MNTNSVNSSMGQWAVSEALSAAPSRQADSPAKIKDAAQQFEALMLSQLLHSAHESGNGWLGAGGDSSGDSLDDFAEQQLAVVMSKNGGLGLAQMIARGLTKPAADE